MIDLKTRLSRVSTGCSITCILGCAYVAEGLREIRNDSRYAVIRVDIRTDSDSSWQVREPAVRPVNPVREGHVKQ